MDQVYTTYFDASGDRSTRFIVVGGFLSNVQDWLQFETAWNAALTKAKVPYFHMKKFVANRKPFDTEKWAKEEIRKNFIASLVDVIARHVDFSPANMLPLDDWRVVNGEYCMEEERLTPFAVAGCMAITEVFEYCKAHQILRKQVKFIFEHGDTDRGDLLYWCERIWKLLPSFEPKIPEDNDPHDLPLAPLQACDFVAWEARRAQGDLVSVWPNTGSYKLRGSFEVLLQRIRLKHRVWNEETLRQLCAMHNIHKRLQDYRFPLPCRL